MASREPAIVRKLLAINKDGVFGKDSRLPQPRVRNFASPFHFEAAQPLAGHIPGSGHTDTSFSMAGYPYCFGSVLGGNSENSQMVGPSVASVMFNRRRCAAIGAKDTLRVAPKFSPQ